MEVNLNEYLAKIYWSTNTKNWRKILGTKVTSGDTWTYDSIPLI